MALKLGMLGMWHTHAPGLVKQVSLMPKEMTFVGFFDPDAKLAAQRKKTWETFLPEVKLFPTAEALLAEKLDGIVVEGRVHDNLKWAKLALESGRPVLLEKPAGDDLDAHRKLIELARRKHLHVQMIYLFRYMTVIQELLQRAKKGDLGAIYSFKARLPKELSSYARFVEELKPYKGGIFFEMAGHVVDLMVALLGKPKSIAPFMGHHHVKEPKTFVDNGVAVFGYDHAWGMLEIPALEVSPHSRRVEVFGTEGAIVIPHLGSGHLPNKDRQSLEVHRKGQADWQKLDLTAATLQVRDLREFAAVVAGKKDPDFSMEHDLIVQETLLKASGMA